MYDEVFVFVQGYCQVWCVKIYSIFSFIFFYLNAYLSCTTTLVSSCKETCIVLINDQSLFLLHLTFAFSGHTYPHIFSPYPH